MSSAMNQNNRGSLFRALAGCVGMLLLASGLLLPGCGGGGGGGAATPEPPAITSQPVNQAVVAGAAATFSVAATGTSLTYQWQASPDGTTWTDVSDATGATLLAAGLVGCASAPPVAPFTVAQAHPLLAAKLRVVTDACVQRRVLVGANHFVVEASEAAAQTVDKNVRAYLLRRELAAQGAPAICGVLNDPQDPQKSFAQVADGTLQKQAPPLKVSAPLSALGDRQSGLPSLLAELQLAAQCAAGDSAKEKTPGTATPELPTLSPQARELAAAIAAPDDMLLYVDLSGNSESGGKIAAQMAAIVGLSVAAAVAAAPAAVAFTGPTAAQIAATHAVSAVGVNFISIDGMLLAGTLVDTRSGRIVWANAVVSAADPMKPDSLGRGLTTDRLLLTLLNRPAAQWSPPGRPAAVAKLVP